MAIPVESLRWYSVDIPKDILRSKSLYLIAKLSEKSKYDAKVLIHYDTDKVQNTEKAYFRFVGEHRHRIHEPPGPTESQLDLEQWNTCIVQYGKKVLYCYSRMICLTGLFPKGAGRAIKFEDLVSGDNVFDNNDAMKPDMLGPDEAIQDSTISVKTENLKGLHGFQRRNVSEIILGIRTPVSSSSLGMVSLTFKKSDKSNGIESSCLPLSVTVVSNVKRAFEREDLTLSTKSEDDICIPETENFAEDGALFADDRSVPDKESVPNELDTSFRTITVAEQFKVDVNVPEDVRSTPGMRNDTDGSDTLSLKKLTRSKTTKRKKQRKKGKFKKKHCKRRRNRKKQVKEKKHQSSTFDIYITRPTCTENSTMNYKKRLQELAVELTCIVKKEKHVKLHVRQDKKSSKKRLYENGTKEMKERRRNKIVESVNDEDEEASLASKKMNDGDQDKRPQKKPFRNKSWSWNTEENFKQKYIDAEDSYQHFLWKEKPTDKYSKEIIKLWRDLTSLSHYEHALRVNAFVYPSRRGKSGKTSYRRNQQGRTHNSQAPEGIPDQYPTQVSDGATGGLDLPPAESVVTSARSIYHSFTTSTPAPTTSLTSSIDAERGLVSRIRGQMPESRFSRPQEPPRHPQYVDEPTRQRTFSNWPMSTGQDPTRMASYGFFYTGRFDLIRCFQCGIGLKDWASADEPLFEHIKHSSDCPFLKELLGQDLLNAYRGNLLTNQFRPITGGTETSSGLPGRLRNPQYADLQARLRSFAKWPATSAQRPQALAEAGLFFTELNDLCRCFTCDGGLQRWDVDDDPWIEHARWFPHCPYVRQIKGQEYINMVQQAAARAREEEQDPAVVLPPLGRREGTGPIEQRMSRLNLDDTGLLNTYDAQRVVGMGYSRKAVILAIHEFNGQAHGERDDFTAADLVRILTEREDRGEALPPDSPTDAYSPPTATLISENMDPEEENRRLRGILKCLQCEVNDTNILFLPCTHHRLCEDCAENAKICPVCGRKIEEKIKTYMS